jgi:trimeric autotransporter adhesin
MANTNAFKIKNGLDLGAYNKSIVGTAVDIFVYDTSKDSDGGAWRHRTQNTSWYNEGESVRRSARKEFPSVALIVADNTSGSYPTVTIYDADDPDLPMWMIFSSINNNSLLGNGGDFSCVYMLNGVLCAGRTTNSKGLSVCNFITEESVSILRNSANYKYVYEGSIAERNDGEGYWNTNDVYDRISGDNIADVTMAVLPSAPMDEASGLLRPTILVAADGGWSIINGLDDNTYQFNFTSNPSVANIGFTPDKERVWWYGSSNAFSNTRGYFELPILTGDVSATYNGFSGISIYDNSTDSLTFPSTGNGWSGNYYGAERSATSTPIVLWDGLWENKISATQNRGLCCYIKPLEYNTGWMQGITKLATLSDVSASNLVGAELVTNGTFASGTSDWTVGGTGASGAVASGQYTLTRNGTSATLTQTISGMTDGANYTISFNLVGTSGSGSARVDFEGSSSNTTNTNGVVSFTATASGTTGTLQFNVMNTASGSITFDNVSLRLAEADRTVHDKGLQVFGTVTKANVATDTDLKYYSGWSTTNYLYQPYNAGLNFTDEMSIMFWVKNWSAGSSLLHRGPSTTRNSETSFLLYNDSGDDYRFVLSNNGTTEYNTEIQLDSETVGWQFVCFTYKQPVVTGFLNGELRVTNPAVDNNIFSQATDQNGLYIGLGPIGSSDSNAQLALLRLSKSAPTPEQISKIYNDEKFLFEDGAQATISGSHSAVNAVSYDEDTTIFYAGTGSELAGYQGLRKVTTESRAVQSVVNAANGLVASN